MARPAPRPPATPATGERQLSLIPPPAPEAGSPASPGAAPPAPSARAAPAPRPEREHWMAIHLPHLALDALARSTPDDAALARRPLLVVENGPQPRVHAANRAARQAGATPGMALADALAVLDTPQLVDHDPEALADQITMLAGVALQFSDHVHPEPAQQRLLLEVGRSRRLFGGLEALRDRARATLCALGFQPRIGLARSPAAARLLAERRDPAIPEDREALRRTLAPVPLDALALPAATREALRAVGLRRLGDLLRLPRAELSRRYGPELLALVDRLLGQRPETLPRFTPAPTLDLSLRLEHEITASSALVFPLKRLLRQAEQQLRGLNRSLQGMTLELRHREGRTRIGLERSHPGIRADQWLSLWQTRLERETLTAPVIGLRLQAERLLDPPGPADAGADLLADAPGATPQDSGFPAALARIRARLGDTAVQRLENRHTPLPETAQQPRHDLEHTPAPGAPTPSQAVCGTALWLQEPQPVAAPAGAQLLGRLEDGWWDHDQDQRRDYALARDRRGRRLWLFRCLRSGQWFHQGFWG